MTRVVRLAALAAVVLTAAACVPSAVTNEGRDIGTLYRGFLVAGVVVGAIVFGLATWAIIRYRGRPDDPLPDQIHGNLKLETLWTAIPVVTVLVLFGFTLVVLSRVDDVSAKPAADIRVQAFRWGWSFSYPEQGVTVSGIGEPGPEVVVPVGEPVRLTITSADVIHSFFVPQFLFKRDAIPGRENVFEFTVAEAGTYGGQCAEFCGIYHSRMPFTVRAVSRAEYDAWLAAQPKTGGDGVSAGSPAASGVPAGSPPASGAPTPSAGAS
jgi:cytochrome c oxidase subunit 2